jgi:hypothetical protein
MAPGRLPAEQSLVEREFSSERAWFSSERERERELSLVQREQFSSEREISWHPAGFLLNKELFSA